MKKLMLIYQIFSPIVLFPTSFFLWYSISNNNIKLALIAVLIPVIFGYVVPGLGTTVFKLWEFDTKFKLGRYTPFHGFVFAGPSAIFAWFCQTNTSGTISYLDIFKTGVVTASVIGFWNWLFDIDVIKCKFAIIRNKPAYFDKDPETIATDYAPGYFGTFGFCYGVSVSYGRMLLEKQHSSIEELLFFLVAITACLIIPVIFSILISYIKHGYPGIKPFEG